MELSFMHLGSERGQTQYLHRGGSSPIRSLPAHFKKLQPTQ